MMPVRLEPAAPRSRVKHSTTEPLRSYSIPSDTIFNLLTLCILMVFPIHIGILNMGLSILYFRGHR